MANCKAFLFPTLYEGFGIPPLEAVACGVPRIVVSDTPCMHEIYGENAEYLNPRDYQVRLQMPLNRQEVNSNLKKYSWKESAEKLKTLL